MKKELLITLSLVGAKCGYEREGDHYVNVDVNDAFCMIFF